MLKIALAAGEPSGDLLGARLIQGLKKILPTDTYFYGIAGPHMAAAGCEAFCSTELLAVRGYIEALASIPRILFIRREFRCKLIDLVPDIFIGIDAPDFNLSLESTLKSKGIKVVHFISPSIWAWRPNRIHKISKAIDHLLCVFPFEKEIYDQSGVKASYVGHPLADIIPVYPNQANARRLLNLDCHRQYVVVMPGSRTSELKLIAPIFFESMKLISAKRPEIRFLLPFYDSSLVKNIQDLLLDYKDLPLDFIFGNIHTAIEASDAALVKSGTSTLEIALFKKPMVISYKVPRITAWMMKRQALLPYVGLPNILAQRFVVPEFLQELAKPDLLCEAVLHQLDDTENRAMLTKIFTDIHKKLKKNTEDLAASIISSGFLKN